MRKFLYFLSSDATHMQTRLNRLAAKGLELTDVEGLFSGQFEKTSRTDLTYLALPYGRAAYFPSETDYRAYGYELIGGFNGIAIFKSLPCVRTDADGVQSLLKKNNNLHPERLTPVLITAVFLVFFLLLTLYNRSVLAATPFWASYLSLAAHFLQGLFFILFAVNLIALQRFYFSAWVHGLTPWIAIGGGLLTLLTIQLDQSGISLLVIPCLLTLACLLTFWQKNRILAISTAAVCVAFLLVGVLFPPISVSESASSYSYSYQTGGTFLVQKTEQWELRNGDDCCATIYRCLTDGLADAVLDRLLDNGSWLETDFGWQSSSGNYILARNGRLIVTISKSDGFDNPAETLASIWN